MIFRILLCLAAVVPAAHAAGQFADEDVQFFQEKVVPVLKDNCLRCHSGSEPEGGLLLTTREGFVEGGDSGSAVDFVSHADSVLLQALNYDGYEMPPTGQLAPAQISAVTTWVEKGLPWPSDMKEIEFEAPHGPPQVNDENKQFWSFQPVAATPVPELGGDIRNPIDAFIAKKLATAGVKPSKAASADVLIRRMHYDLLGLPPSAQFLTDWTKKLQPIGSEVIDQDQVLLLIDELLASPHYGERWGRHWLDLVRFAETNSYERDGAKPFVWRYRDYVIRAFNEDTPYDQFIREQLAGDELDQVTPNSIIATGYYRLGRWDDEPADPKLAFYDDIDDIVSTTSQAFLGLTVNCARCHDHKIDPIPQRDYYRMVAFFHNIRRYGVRSNESVLAASVREIDQQTDEATFKAAQARYQNQLTDVETKLQRIEKKIQADLQDVEKEELQYDMNRIPIVAKRKGTLLTDKEFNRYKQNFERLQKLREDKPTGLASALCVTENIHKVKPVFILTRGNPHAEGDEVTPGFPSILSPPEISIPDAGEGAVSSGRRRVLADWIASSDNPLTARVMVNRIWQFHFGRGIVRSSSDFGFQGLAPTHPKLLDWLAQRFVETGWSIKTMHRLVMSSDAYQMSSAGNDDAYAIDPNNDLLWRFDMRRLSAEEIRDSILWANGSLNTQKMYGPSIYTDIPDAVKAGQSRPGSGWGNSSPEDKARRSIYIHVKRSLQDPLLQSFDSADTDLPCPVRFVTVQPTQALGMINSEFINKQAQVFADFLKSQTTDRTQQIQMALNRVTQRTATDLEVQHGHELMTSLQSEHGLSSGQALKYFCLVALNLNEFIYLD
ncbi:MAG: DUF1553 domain-containing protein [Fuerstiella sp.]